MCRRRRLRRGDIRELQSVAATAAPEKVPCRSGPASIVAVVNDAAPLAAEPALSRAEPQGRARSRLGMMSWRRRMFWTATLTSALLAVGLFGPAAS